MGPIRFQDVFRDGSWGAYYSVYLESLAPNDQSQMVKLRLFRWDGGFPMCFSTPRGLLLHKAMRCEAGLFASDAVKTAQDLSSNLNSFLVTQWQVICAHTENIWLQILVIRWQLFIVWYEHGLHSLSFAGSGGTWGQSVRPMAKVGLVRRRSQATAKTGFRKIPWSYICFLLKKGFMNYWWCGIAYIHWKFKDETTASERSQKEGIFEYHSLIYNIEYTDLVRSTHTYALQRWSKPHWTMN